MDIDFTSDELVLISTVFSNLYAASVAEGEDPGLLETITIKLEGYLCEDHFLN